MRVAIGSDHAGVNLKDAVRRQLESRGIAHTDFGTRTGDPVDYPDVAGLVAREVAAGAYDRGILVCGSGLGMAIAANKIAGIRATPVSDERAARLSREHNDANVLTLGERFTPADQAERIVDVFLDTPFGGDRHQRRVNKIAELERA